MSENIRTLIFSMLTAIITGGVISLIVIFGFHYILNYYFFNNNPSIISLSNTTLIEESEEDPTFISRFSRGFIYSADDVRKVIESAKNSLPTSGKVKVSAPSYVVMDMNRKVIVLEKNADKILPLASVTKLVTAVIAKKLLDQEKNITITKKVLASYGNEAKFREEEKFKIKELLFPLLMVSSNDASEALAQEYGRQNFIKEMNNWANSIGAYRTYFADPSGLSKQNVSTARDLSIITQWIFENNHDIFEITLLKAKTIRTHTWINPTHFLNLASYAGGKNGYTPEADRTSVSLFKLGNQKRTYSIILLGSSARDNDILDLLDEAVR